MCYIKVVKSGVFVDFSRGVSVGRPMCQLGLTLDELSHTVRKRLQHGKVLAVILNNRLLDVI